MPPNQSSDTTCNQTTEPSLSNRYALGHENIMGQHTSSEELLEHQPIQEKQAALLDVVQHIATNVLIDNKTENTAQSKVDVSCNLEREKGIKSIVESQANLIGMQDSLERTSENNQDVGTPTNASVHLETLQQATVTQDMEQEKLKSIEDTITIEQKGAKSQSKSTNLAKQQSHSIVVSIFKKYTSFMI